ncbi:hypothetical protein [Virgibacillus indicus]|nr:hypothetical protein [Virgibacillus indicus]
MDEKLIRVGTAYIPVADVEVPADHLSFHCEYCIQCFSNCFSDSGGVLGR